MNEKGTFLFFEAAYSLSDFLYSIMKKIAAAIKAVPPINRANSSRTTEYKLPAIITRGNANSLA